MVIPLPASRGYDGKKQRRTYVYVTSRKKLSGAAAIAQFKLAVIAPAIHGLYPDASRNAYYKRVTQQPLTLPDGSTAHYKPGTLSKWESLYITFRRFD